jgi:hypothetical protein
MASSALLGYAGAIIYIKGRQVLVWPSAETLARDTRAPVLYLRSFRSDAHASQPVSSALPFLPSLTPEEEQIADGMLPIGPFAGLGVPGEKLPPLGAARLYAKEDEWHQPVLDLMRKSALVVIRVGRTDSLRWEVEQYVVGGMPPEKLLLLVSDRAEYDAFRKQIWDKVSGLPPLPQYKKSPYPILFETQPATHIKAFIYFARDWTPNFMCLLAPRWRSGSPLGRALRSTMRPVYRQLNLSWHPPPYSMPKIVAAGALVLLLALGFQSS